MYDHSKHSESHSNGRAREGGASWSSERFAGEPPQQAGNAQIRHVLDAFRRRWVLAVFPGLILGGAAAAAIWYFMPTMYTAQAQLHVNPNTTFFYSNRQTGEQQILFDDYKRNLMFMAKSPMVATAALRLQPELQQSATLQNVEYRETFLEQEIQVGNNGPEWIRVAMTGRHPEDLKNIVNAVVKAMMTEVVDKDTLQRMTRLENLQSVAEGKRKELANKQAELEKLDYQIQTANREQGNQQVEARKALWLQVRQELGQIKLQIIELQVQKAVLDQTPEESVDEIVIPDEVVDAQLAEDPEFQTLYLAMRRQEELVETSRIRFDKDNPVGAARIAEAEQELSVAEERLDAYRTENLPLVREQLRRLASAVPIITDSNTLDAQIAVLVATEQKLEEELATIRVEERDLTTSLIQRERLVEQVELLKARVQQYDDSIEMRKVELENGEPPIEEEEIVYAETPREPDNARRTKLAGMAGMGLFGLLGALVVWLELVTRRVSRIKDVEQELKLPVIGSVPQMPRFTMSGNQQGERQGKAAYWHSVLAESIDSTRTMLLRLAKDSNLKTVMVASAMSGEGKTSVSCHLATSLARAGRRVLLMDCDIRRPSINLVFGIGNEPGFCELLCDGATPDEVIREVSPPGLSVLPAGQVHTEVLRHLAQDDIGEILAQIGEGFDFVIIDTSPILPVTDALLFAQHVDGVLFSIRRDVSRVSKVETAVQRLNMLGAPLLGAVAIGMTEGVYGSRYQYQAYPYPMGHLKDDSLLVAAGTASATDAD